MLWDTVPAGIKGSGVCRVEVGGVPEVSGTAVPGRAEHLCFGGGGVNLADVESGFAIAANQTTLPLHQTLPNPLPRSRCRNSGKQQSQKSFRADQSCLAALFVVISSPALLTSPISLLFGPEELFFTQKKKSFTFWVTENNFIPQVEQ